MDKFDYDKIEKEVELFLPLYTDNKNLQDDIEWFKQICYIITKRCNNKTFVVDTIKRYFENGILTPLALDDKEFPFTGGLIRFNNRYPDIVLNTDDDIIYYNAYRPEIKHYYNSITKEEEPIFPTHIDIEKAKCPLLYFTKGGNIIGEYIYECQLKPATVKRGNYTPHPPIAIPCSVIETKDDLIFTVDIREPKIAVLKTFYNVIIKQTKDYPKYDIRKFKKIKELKRWQ